VPGDLNQNGLWLLLVLLAAGVPVAASRTLRLSLRDGLRCLGSESLLWRLPVLFVTVYAAYQLLADWLLRWRSGEETVALWDWSFDLAGYSAAFSPERLIQAVQQTSSLFDSLVTVYPVSMIFGLAYLFNFRRLRSEFGKVVGRRFTRAGWLVLAGFFICAIAAIMRPAVQLCLPELAALLPTVFPWLLPLFSLLALAFEFAAAVAVQTFLIVTVFLWSRGIRTTRLRVYRLTAHRFGLVVKLSLAVLALFITLVILPAAWEFGTGLLAGAPTASLDLFKTLATNASLVQAVVALTLLLCCTVQVRLAIHNRSLRQAVADHFRFVRSHAGAIIAFIFFALTVFLLVDETAALLLAGLEQSGMAWLEIAAYLKYAISAALAGWLLASWILFYRRLEGAFRELLY